jgi:hypothetical protein
MKFLALLFIASVLPASAFADKGKITKLFDGKFAQCETAKDLGSRAYLPTGLAAKNNASILSVVFVLQHFKCEARGEGFDWAANAHPLDPKEDHDLYDRTIILNQTNSEAVLVRGSDAAILSVIPLEESSEQSLSFGFDLRQLLTPSELTVLDSGAALDARATFFTRSQVSVQTQSGQNIVLGLRSGGAYSILLTLKKADSGQIQVAGAILK